MSLFANIHDMLTSIVAVIFLISSLGTIFYYVYFFSQTGRKKVKEIRKDLLPPVSVIICARDEAENLRKNLPAVLEQDYPDYEVIVVDDCSDDDTQDLLMHFCKQYKNLKHTRIIKDPKFSHSKKLALTVGIKASRNEYLLMTDADCYPSGNQWIRNMASNYEKDIELVIAYGAYETHPGLLNRLIRYETVFTAMQFMGFAERGFPFMGVGRNLSYRKSLFFRNKGFASHLGLVSGDDDLFVNETAIPENTAIETDPHSFTISTPKRNFKDWFRQRKRHFTTSSRYKPTSRLLLATEYLLRVLHILTFVFLLINGFMVIWVVSVFFLTLIVKAIIYKIVLKRLNEKYLFLFSLIIEPLIPYIYIFIHFSNILDKKRIKWN